MKLFPHFLVSALFFFPTATAEISDDFSGPALDPSKWSLEAEGGNFILNGGRLNYLRTGTPSDDDFAVLEFTTEQPGYDESWEVIVDVTNTAVRSNPATQHSGAGIAILANEHSYRHDEIFLELGDENSVSKRFSSNFITNDVDLPHLDAIHGAGATGGSLRISYDGTSKVFSIQVDADGSSNGFQWHPLASYGIAGSGGTRNTNWNMTSNGTFIIALFGLSSNLTVASGAITFDDFLFRQTDASPPAYNDWKIANFGSTAAPDSGIFDDKDQDGLFNIIEYAFGLDPNQSGDPILTPGTGVSGLPHIAPEKEGETLSLAIEYVRRKESSSPGIVYEAQFSSDLSEVGTDGWQVAVQEIVTSIDSDWERVVVKDQTGGPRRFGRVRVSVQP